MLVVIAIHGLDQADIIHLFAKMGKQVADQGPAVPARLEVPQRAQQLALLVRQTATYPHHLAIGFEQFRLVVKAVHVRRATIGKHEDDSLRLGCIVSRSCRQWINCVGTVRSEQL